jgi:hypothetical protein
MKWKLLVFIIIYVLIPIPAFASSSVDISITATPIVAGWVLAPADFTVTRITDTNVKLDWTPDPSAAFTLILAKIGSEPTSPMDGYIVYSGNGSTANDTSLDLNIIGGVVYYTAYSQNASGSYSATASTGYLEGIPMTLLILLALSCALTWFYWKQKWNALWAIITGFAWLATCFYVASNPPTNVTTGSFVHQVILVILLGAGITIFFLWLRNRDNRMSDTGRSEYTQAEENARRPSNKSPLAMNETEYKAYLRTRRARR